MASLDEMSEKFSKLERYDGRNNICCFLSTRIHLDEIIVNNKSIPESSLPILSYEHESQLRKTVETISERDLRYYLSQFEDCCEVAEKLLILKDHKYYHYILLHTVMGLRYHCSTDEFGISHHFIAKNAGELKACKNIIQEKITLLAAKGSHFEERPYSVSKCPDVSRINVEHREEHRGEELELEPLKSKYSNLCEADKASENSMCTSVLLYMSEGAKRCFNCNVYRNSALVTCRHLTAWWLKLKEFEYGTIDSEENIAKCKKIPSDAELGKSFNYNGCPSEGIYFEISQFHNIIYDVAISLSEGQEKRYLVYSCIHNMGLCVKRNKYNNIIIYYYDPNDTLRHKEIIAKTAGDLKYLCYDDFWSSVDVYTYFPEKDKVCCLVSLDTKALQQDCEIVCTPKPSASLMHLLSRFGHCGHPTVCFDLNRLDKNTKKEVIAGKNKCGTPALFVACMNGHLEALYALLAMITKIDCEPVVKNELLEGRRADGTSALFIACQNGHYKLVTVLIARVFSGDLNLSNGEKAEFLAGKSLSGCPALYIACEVGHHEVVDAIIAKICSDDFNLDNDKKAELLAGNNKGGCSALYIACQNGNLDIVTALVSAICSDDLCLSAAGKAKLLAGTGGEGYYALFIACQNGYHEIVIVLITAICRGDLNFTNTEKEELLAGGNCCSALNQACRNGHIDVVTALVSAICSSDLSLSQSEKAELLAGKNADGVSALEVAGRKGYDRIVKVLRDCGM